MKDKVSIIVPVYNVGRYLSKCVNSLIKQTYSNIEIILVDDGSKDESVEICNEYKKNDSRIKVIHKQNNGVSAARNTGIENATGEYICFVDGDDYVMEDYVEYLVNLLEKNNGDISLTTEMFGNFNIEQTKCESVKIWNGEDASEGILCYKVPIGVYCKLFKKSFIDDKKIRFFEDIFMGEGFNFNVYAFQRANKIIVGNRKIYYYRRDNSTSATTKFSIKKCENSLYALDVMKEKFVIKSNRVMRAWEYAKWRTYSDAFDYMVLGNGVRDNKDEYKKYKRYIKHNANIAKYVPISKKDRYRAHIMKINPGFIPILLKLRRMKYKVKIER